ncbi:hypothetical protein HOLleu_12807 [Holothuria leucospilota]|uniref:Uncharacterized protein n=1 Tax=Holothuria leucospilota TaxID=206669 RepID=A0A9Q1C9W5_HOLLE|nr:hypothetical protein HOLleu_12807 [Holothuria leucospilota]
MIFSSKVTMENCRLKSSNNWPLIPRCSKWKLNFDLQISRDLLRSAVDEQSDENDFNDADEQFAVFTKKKIVACLEKD